MFEDAIEEIRDAIPGMSPQQQKVGLYFVEHPETLGVLSLSEFARRIGTSGPTVNRFCHTLGYDGFLEFSRAMHVLRNGEISHASYFHNSRVRHKKSGDCGALGRQLLEKDAANVRKLIDGYPDEKIAACVSLMLQSSSIAVLGKMSAYPAAVYFEQLLSKITPRLIPMTGADVLQAAALSRLDKKSLVFCMAFPRYPKSVVELSREAARKGAKIIAITNNEFSPLADICDLLFTADVEIFSYIDLFGPVFALINIICLEFSLKQGGHSERNLASYDRIVADAYFLSSRKPGPKKDSGDGPAAFSDGNE